MDIVLNANEDYMKYLAVLCWSIVEKAKSSGRGGGIEFREDKSPAFCFHILTDAISPQMREKFSAFELELKAVYPCSFCFYVVESKLFESFRELNGNHLTYFRLKMAEILPQEIKRCLYLDVDMLCVSDLREIFTLDLKGKLCGAVLDAHYLPYRGVSSRDPQKEEIALKLETYFNAGMMLIDLEQWRQKEIGKRSFELLRFYDPTWHDQDTLNAILSEDVLLLPMKWNFMLGHFLFPRLRFVGSGASKKKMYFGANEQFCGVLTCSKEEYLQAREEMKILHFLTSLKPWSQGDFCEQRASSLFIQYKKQWWDKAIETPIFGEEFAQLYDIALQEPCTLSWRDKILFQFKKYCKAF